MNNNTKTILVTYPDDFAINEAKSLVNSISEYEIIKVFTQKHLNRAKYGMGTGKAQEIEEFVKETLNIETMIVDEHLSSKQIFNLEQLLNIKVIDRERLILDIFYSRAKTIEAKLQIQLAEIQYQMPRIREKLKDAQLKRHVYHQQRLKMRMPIVSLVGYTSSGKTTLFNLLTKENKETSASLFTTLSTTTRSLKTADKKNDDNNYYHQKNEEILIVDTVGFISRLPHYMIDAFKSTLEESLVADLILLLIDCSEEFENIRRKYSSCWDVLEELKVDKSKVFIVLSKADKTTSSAINKIIDNLNIISNTTTANKEIIISSKTGYGIHKLKNMITSRQYLEKKEKISMN